MKRNSPRKIKAGGVTYHLAKENFGAGEEMEIYKHHPLYIGGAENNPKDLMRIRRIGWAESERLTFLADLVLLLLMNTTQPKPTERAMQAAMPDANLKVDKMGNLIN